MCLLYGSSLWHEQIKVLAAIGCFKNSSNQCIPAAEANYECVDIAINELVLAASQLSEQFLQNACTIVSC